MKLSRTAKWRNRLIAAGCGAGLISGTLLLIADHTRGAEIATDIAVPISVLSLLEAIFGFSLRSSAPDHQALVAAARELAHDVAIRESQEQLKLLADTGAARPANVRFSSSTVNISWRTDGGGRRGSLAQIAEFYSQLGRGRLVVLGEPGSGKTVLINQLLLDLIERLPQSDPEPGQTLLIPVRLSLPAFDPSLGSNRADEARESKRHSAWIARHLTAVYGTPPAISAALVESGWILPVLDGLDEMDPEGPEPVKAAATVRALNHTVGTGPRRVIIACRRARYRALASATPVAGRPHVLEDATVIELEPLTVPQVIAHIGTRINHSRRALKRWQPVIEHLRAQPTSPLAEALQSPLRLFVAVTAYYAGDPGELLTLPAADFDRHLFNRLVPAIVEQHPGPGGLDYDGPDVARWPTSIARHLRRRAEQGSSESDLELHHLWSAAGERKPRYVAFTAQKSRRCAPKRGS